MSIRALNWAWEQRAGSPTAKAVLAALADMADELHSCFPRIEFIADRVEVSESTIKRVLKQLEKAGFLHRERRYLSYGKRTTDRYVLAVGQMIDMPVSSLEVNLTPNEELDKTPDQTLEVNLTPNEVGAASLEVNCDPYKENPEKIDKSIFIGNELSAESAPQPDQSISQIDAKLSKIHPALSVIAIRSRLKVADIADVDVVRATQTLLARATRTVRNPVAFVVAGIDRAPESWRPMLPGFEPGSDVSGELSASEAGRIQRKALIEACNRGEHDWGSGSWPEVDRAYCLNCELSRREVDPTFRELLDEHDRFKFGRGVS